MISKATKNQLRYTAKYNIITGYIRDKRVSKVKVNEVHYEIGIHKFDFVEYEERKVFNPMEISFDKEDMEYWESMDEVTINQPEFNSLGLNYMHFKDERLSKSNPYIVKKVWIEFGENNKKPFIAFQQLYTDTIRVKIIGPPEDIQAIKNLKRYEEKFDVNDELERIRKYSGNDFHRRKKEIITTTSGERYEVTTHEDYDVTYEIWEKWQSYGKALKASNRLYWLDEQISKIEEKIFNLSDLEKEIYKIMAQQYEIHIYSIDEKYQLVQDMDIISKEQGVHPAEIWKAWYCYQLPILKREYKWLESQF